MNKHERSPFVEHAIDVITVGIMVAGCMVIVGLTAVGFAWLAGKVL